MFEKNYRRKQETKEKKFDEIFHIFHFVIETIQTEIEALESIFLVIFLRENCLNEIYKLRKK